VESRDVGRNFVEALAGRDLEALRAAVSEGIRFRLLLPKGAQQEDGAAATAGRFIGWFGDAEALELQASTVDWVADRMAITYRFRLQDRDGWKLIEQHLMVDVDEGGRMEAIDLLCSGFRALPDPVSNGVHRFDAGDLGCADGLAAEFRRRIQAVPVGDVLAVTARDPAAKEDLPPLARMMGHTVRSVDALDDRGVLITVERGR
jgi:TusA-related sulfurtransferase/ketosteroid isomerase-like protein